MEIDPIHRVPEEPLVFRQMDDPVPFGAGIIMKELVGAADTNFFYPWTLISRRC